MTATLPSTHPPTGTHRAGDAPTDEPLSFGARIAGGLVGGFVAGLALNVVLSVAALLEGHGVTYPWAAVHAMMTGARVLPDDPVGSLHEGTIFDWVAGPVYFYLPALVVGLVAVGWVSRSGAAPSTWWRAAAAPVVLLTAAFFCLFVLVLGNRTADVAVQKISSGHGVRELGLPAWAIAHAVYVVVLVAVLAPVTRWMAELGQRRRDGTVRQLPGD